MIEAASLLSRPEDEERPASQLFRSRARFLSLPARTFSRSVLAADSTGMLALDATALAYNVLAGGGHGGGSSYGASSTAAALASAATAAVTGHGSTPTGSTAYGGHGGGSGNSQKALQHARSKCAQPPLSFPGRAYPLTVPVSLRAQPPQGTQSTTSRSSALLSASSSSATSSSREARHRCNPGIGSDGKAGNEGSLSVRFFRALQS